MALIDPQHRNNAYFLRLCEVLKLQQEWVLLRVRINRKRLCNHGWCGVAVVWGR
jgi:hypothetical protein